MAEMNGYTSAETIAMQKDAIRRVNEMRRLSNEKLRQTQEAFSAGNHPGQKAPEARQEKFEPEFHEQGRVGAQQYPLRAKEEPEVIACEPEIAKSGLQGILQRLNLDSDSIILIVMLLLLINEGADVMLIMALVYILL